jgi:hypothetical protein
MLQEMQHDLRRMAIAMVGIPHPNHASARYAEQHLWSSSSQQRHWQLPTTQRDTPPLYPGVELDDAIIHFRCGDLMNLKHAGYAFLKFNDYVHYISPEARTIGIVTQPFGKTGQQRLIDEETSQRCEMAVMALVDYIQERHPHAQIRIHNDANETIALTYARMIMANQSNAGGISSFGVFAPMANFGTGYVRYPVLAKEPNRWLRDLQTVESIRVIAQPDIVLYETPKMLPVASVRSSFERDPTGTWVLEWMRNDTMR